MKPQNIIASALPGGGDAMVSSNRSSNGPLGTGHASDGCGMGPSVTLVSYKTPDHGAPFRGGNASLPQGKQAGGPPLSVTATKAKSPYLVRPGGQQTHDGGVTDRASSGAPTSQPHERPSTAPLRKPDR